MLGFDNCWLWTGGTRVNANGEPYGRFWIGKRAVAAHRFAYVLAYGPIPRSRIVCHHCDTPLCCNPRHLYAGTHTTNAQDRERRGRRPILAGEAHPLARLSNADVATIRATYAAGGVTQRDLAERFGCRPQHVSRIVRGRKRGATTAERRTHRLTQSDADAIRLACAAGERQADVGARFGITQPHVSHIVNGRAW